MCSQTDCTLGNIIIIDKQQPKDHTISLYPRYNTYLEPNSVTYIPLKCRQKTEIKFNKDKDLLIKGNNSFEKRKLLQLDHINICTLQNPTIAILNTQDTGVTVSKKDVIASAEPCDDEMQYHANVQMLE